MSLNKPDSVRPVRIRTRFKVSNFSGATGLISFIGIDTRWSQQQTIGSFFRLHILPRGEQARLEPALIFGLAVFGENRLFTVRESPVFFE
jgi:hypothetical protein